MLVVALVLAPSRSLRAAEASPIVRPVDRAYEAGKVALRARAFGEAVDAFAQALGLASQEPEVWRALLGLALAYELSGDLLASDVHYRRFLERSARSPLAAGSEWGPRRVEASASAERLERSLAVTHARVVVTTTPAGARVVIAPSLPSDCATTPCTFFAPPGRYAVTLSDGDHVSEQVVVAVAGQRHEVTADFRPEVPQVPHEIVPRLRPRTWPAEATWTIVGGGAALVTGAIFTGLAAGDHADLETLAGQPGTDDVLRDYDRTRARMQSRETTAWVFYVVGGVAVVTGVIIGLTAEPARIANDGLTLRF